MSTRRRIQPDLTRSTRRLTVRPYTLDDFAAWRRAHLDSQHPRSIFEQETKPTRLEHPDFVRIVEEHRQMRLAGSGYELAMFRRRSGTLIGGVSLTSVSRGIFQNAYLGYTVLNPHWGHGYAQEGVRACLDIAFRDLALHRVEAGIELRNLRSRAVARRVNLRCEGISRRRLYVRGAWRDLALYAITCEEWGMAASAPDVR
jgi:[ribosomal protein S5]-alanine N-acetyltransferase